MEHPGAEHGPEQRLPLERLGRTTHEHRGQPVPRLSARSGDRGLLVRDSADFQVGGHRMSRPGIARGGVDDLQSGSPVRAHRLEH